MPKISIRISEDKQAVLSAAARRANKNISAYIRDLLLLEPEKTFPNLEQERHFYIITRLLLLSLAQSMSAADVMDNYQKINQDAEEKFRR